MTNLSQFYLDNSYNDCYWEEPNSKSDGNKISVTDQISSVDDCAKICEETKYCNGFDYHLEGDVNEGYCYLKQGATKITEDAEYEGIRSGGICEISGE